MPTEGELPGGIMIPGNPGVTAVWICYEYRPFRVQADPASGAHAGTLFEIGDPSRIEFWREGRQANAEEIAEAIKTGLPRLMEVSIKEGPVSVAATHRAVERFERLLVDAVPA